MSNVDWNAALESVNSDHKLLREVVTLLAQELPVLREALRVAVSKKSENDTRNAAHKLKGSLRFLGPTESHDLAQEIELFEPMDFERAAQIHVQLDRALDVLKRDLEDFTTSS